MNIKSLVATFALITAATTTAAMADGKAQGGITVAGSFSANATGPIVRDHRTPAPPVVGPPAPAIYRPVYRPAPQIAQHTRIDWRGRGNYDPGYYQDQEPTISCNAQSFSVLATDHLIY